MDLSQIKTSEFQVDGKPFVVEVSGTINQYFDNDNINNDNKYIIDNNDDSSNNNDNKNRNNDVECRDVEVSWSSGYFSGIWITR